MPQSTLSDRMSVLLLAGLLAACSGDSSPTRPIGGGAPQMHRQVVVDPSFRQHVMEIFERTGCTSSSCHGIGQGGMVIGPDPSVNYRNIVNVPAESENFLRIKPFDPDSSYIVIKLEGRQLVGEPMPPMPLDSIDLTNIRNWIVNGALDN